MLKSLDVVLKLRFRHFVNLVYHEDVLLKAAKELLEPWLWRSLRLLLALARYGIDSIRRGGAGCARVLHLKVLIGVSPADKIFNHALDGISIRQHVDVVVIYEVVC
jgi:hypothetical protein